MTEATGSEPTRAGRCLCGAVQFSVSGTMRDVLNCHCDRCRRFSGHHVAATAAPAENITMTGTTDVKWFHPADDPNVAYGSCPACGSSLAWTAGDSLEWSIFAGTLDQPTGLKTAQNWWTSQAGDYHQLDPQIPALDTEPLHPK